jgi:hypothetical protein
MAVIHDTIMMKERQRMSALKEPIRMVGFRSSLDSDSEALKLPHMVFPNDGPYMPSADVAIINPNGMRSATAWQ